MEETKIRKLLKKYGVEEAEIENFMQDLAEYKEDIEEIEHAQEDEDKGVNEYQEMADTNKTDENDKIFEKMAEDEDEHDDYLFNAKNLAILKATDEGKDLIINAPKMAKEELAEAIKKLLNN